MKRTTLQLCSTSLFALCAVACGSDDEGTSLPANASAAIENYANIVHASYEDSLEAAQALDAAIDSFIAAPSAPGLASARTAWLASREPYLQTEVYRFYDGPIDNPEDGPEGLINAWPLDENYIDYVVGGEDEGMINDPSMTIDKDAILGANEGIDEKSISTGYHAIEFLLWGQDQSDEGPGDRRFTDYVTDGTGTNENQARRGQYLAAVSDLLVEHLQSLVDAWAPNVSSNYRAEFLALEPADALGRLMSGMIILSGFETGTERLQAALDARDQEEEHSCFSDNTHRDMVQDINGVRNVWWGRYERTNDSLVQGPGVRDLIAAGNNDVATRLSAQIDVSLEAALALQPPFDQEIAVGNSAGNARVQAVIDALDVQKDQLEEAFRVYGLQRIPDPS